MEEKRAGIIQIPFDEIKGLDIEEFLMYATTPKSPQLMNDLLETPHSAEKLLAFAMNVCLPMHMGYAKIQRDMLQKGLVATGREVVPMSLSMDFLKKVSKFMDILESYCEGQTRKLLTEKNEEESSDG